MKKLTLSIILSGLILLTGFSNPSRAQIPLSFGVKGGVNIANISGDELDYDSRTGITIGAVLDISIPLSPIGVESGLYYSQKGATFSSDYESMHSDGTIKLDYLEIPVLAKLGFGPPGPVSPHIVAGPYAAFILNAESESRWNGESQTSDLSDETESMDYGLIIGIGADLNLMVTKINLQARYSMGLKDVFEDFDSRNRVISIVAGFSF